MAKWLVTFEGEIEVEADDEFGAILDAERKSSLFDHASASYLDLMCEFCDEKPATVTDADGQKLCQGCYDDGVAEMEAEDEAN